MFSPPIQPNACVDVEAPEPFRGTAVDEAVEVAVVEDEVVEVSAVEAFLASPELVSAELPKYRHTSQVS